MISPKAFTWHFSQQGCTRGVETAVAVLTCCCRMNWLLLQQLLNRWNLISWQYALSSSLPLVSEIVQQELNVTAGSGSSLYQRAGSRQLCWSHLSPLFCEIAEG